MERPANLPVSLILLALIFAMRPFAASALEVRGKVAIVEVGDRLKVNLPQGTAVAPGDMVMIEAEVPGLGPVAIKPRWRIKRTEPGIATAESEHPPSNHPKAGDDAIVELSAPHPKRVSIKPVQFAGGQKGGFDPRSLELAFWNSVRDASDPEMLETYLRRYPDGIFADLARLKIKRLRTQKAGGKPRSAFPAASSSPPDETPGPMQACDRLAAHPDDPDKSGDGISFDLIQADKAIQACRLAVRAFPDIPRLSFQLGRALYKKQRSQKAFQAYLTAANAGYPMACSMVGAMYADGVGVRKNETEAIKWLKEAASDANSDALFSLGVMYWRGKGVKRDQAAAIKLFRAAAEKGNAYSMFMLGLLHFNGGVVEQNPREGLAWFRKAANKASGLLKQKAENFRDFALAQCRGFGQCGLTRDDHAAALHMMKALKGGFDIARNDLTTRWRLWPENFRVELQGLMYVDGVYDGSFDGKYGPRTKQAINALVENTRADKGSEPIPKGMVRKTISVTLGRAKGKARGWLGVNIAAVTDEIAQALGFGGFRKGAVVTHVYPSSPASKVGIQPGYLILGIHGQVVDDYKDVGKLITPLSPGKQIDVVVLRPKLTEAQAQRTTDSDSTSKDKAPADREILPKEAAIKLSDEAVNSIMRSAESGDARAMRLAGALDSGLIRRKHGENRKYGKQAERWYRAAAKLGDADSMLALGAFYRFRRHDNTKAIHWYSLCARKGHVSCMLALAKILGDGTGIGKDEKKAFDWIRNAAEKGDRTAQYELAGMYRKGQGVIADEQMAIHWYRKAAGQDSTLAMYALGEMSMQGEGVVKDPKAATHWYRRAAEKGNVAAMAELGDIYLHGRGVPRDSEKAKSWLDQAAQRGNSDAMCFLAEMYEKGLGVARDAETSADWMIKALEQHNLRAADALIIRWDAWSQAFREKLQLKLRRKMDFQGPVNGTFSSNTAAAITSLMTQAR
jgi:TPR repeat protein